MNTVTLITRHRQWRSWQFARRRSGLFSGGDGMPDPDDDPDNGKSMVVVLIYFVLMIIFAFVWPTAAIYMFAGLILFLIIGIILIIIF